ncbi:MAG: penicillin-binding protein 2 [Patescibacteria group bacterium]
MKFWRVNLVLIFLIIFGLALSAKLFLIQIRDHEYWKALAQGQQKFFDQKEGKRGEIFLEIQNNDVKILPLAINKEEELVFVSPFDISKKGKDFEEVAKELSQILKEDENSILEKIQQGEKDESLYVLIKNRLNSEEVGILKKANLPGVHLKKENLRYYPQEEFASKVIGFLGGDSGGQYGIEGYYNENLTGSEGIQGGERSAWGYLIKLTSKPIEEGSDLILTLDYNIQFTAEKLLKEAKEELGIEGGQIIVGDPKDGKILAMADFPSFNPNQYTKESDLEVFKNSAIQKIFEPGSVFKPITMVAGLDTKKVTPETKYVDEGIIKIGGYKIYNYGQRTWGNQTMNEVLEKSINTGAVFVERQIGHQTFLNYIEKFGFFDPTGITLQGEVFSTNSNFKKGYEVNFATASFGQGIEMTPLQLFRAISVIANGGKMANPYIVKKIIKDEKEIITQPKVSQNLIVSQDAVNQVTSMMINVIEKGYGKTAKVPGYYIAGKTGTAQIPFGALGINRSGYSDKTWQTFVGFAPAFNPRFVILVKLDNPKSRTAEYSAAPIFGKLAKYIIGLWQIPPDQEVEEK